MKKLISLLFMAFAVTAHAKTKPVSVFIYAGQSNADGRALVTDMPNYLKQNEQDGTWRPYRYLAFANITKEGNGQFGDQAFIHDNSKRRFAFCDVTNHLIEKKLRRRFYAVKCTYGGSAIDPTARPAKVPTWYADAAWLKVHQAYAGEAIDQEPFKDNNSLAKALTERFRMLCDTTLARLKEGYDVKAIMWMQGESDRPATAAAAYYDNLKTLITYFRQSIAKATGHKKDQELPFIMATMPTNSKQFSPVVKAAQQRVARDLPNVYIIELGNVTLLPDRLHLDAKATEALGRQMFNCLKAHHLVE